MIKEFDDKIIYYPSYKITNFGNIINKNGYKLRYYLRNGYRANTIYKNGVRKKISIHKYVAFFFCSGRTPEKSIVNHKDENRNNPHFSNLEWVTQSDNIIHSIWKRVKPVDQFDKNTGEFIERFSSIKNAGKKLGISNSSSISGVCKNVFKSAYGFIWKYADLKKDIPIAVTPVKKSTHNCKPVDQFNLNGKFIQRYNSITEAARTLNIDNSLISRCTSGENKTATGFMWKFAGNEIVDKIEIPKKKKGGKLVDQYDMDGNFIKSFDSIAEAGKFINRHPSQISRCCNGKAKTCYGCIWKFSDSPLVQDY